MTDSPEEVETALMPKQSFYRSFLKRGLDLLISVPALILFSPLLLLCALAVLLESGRPVIFRQDRIGYHGKVFRMYKFRSMILNAEHTGSGVYSEENDDRVTKSGRVLRGLSLDELPQLINIIKGDMSLIGPRPPLTYHPWSFDRYTKEQLHMFDVRPGITGWWAANGRNDTDYDERLRLEYYYCRNCGVGLDIKCIFKTIVAVFRKTGAK